MSSIVDQLPRLPKRDAASHKGTFGRVLVIAGSPGMSGAAVLCGSAALRGGAGLVQVACPREIQAIVASGQSCYTTLGWQQASIEEIEPAIQSADVLAIGPGLNIGNQSHFIRDILTRHPDRPTVIDASGLDGLSSTLASLPRRTSPLVLTPHPGEFARMIGQSTAEVQNNRLNLANSFAQQFGVILVLKGQHSIVTDGNRHYRNSTGNPGMATGGTGDVLTGLVAAFLAVSADPFAGVALAVAVHGHAGDLAASELGQTSMIASDLLTYLPRAIREMAEA